MKKNRRIALDIALGQYLSEVIPAEKYEGLSLEELTNSVTIWEPFENWDMVEITVMIDVLAMRIESALDDVEKDRSVICDEANSEPYEYDKYMAEVWIDMWDEYSHRLDGDTQNQLNMNRKEAKRWLPEVIHWANGGELWATNEGNDWFKQGELVLNEYTCAVSTFNIIEDRHFEARKAHALGEPIEVLGVIGGWSTIDNPTWSQSDQYRPEKKEWYENIPKEGVLCWVWDTTSVERRASLVVKYIPNDKTHNFQTTVTKWKYAEPIKPEECYQEN
jgi:hypothetical protein